MLNKKNFAIATLLAGALGVSGLDFLGGLARDLVAGLLWVVAPPFRCVSTRERELLLRLPAACCLLASASASVCPAFVLSAGL